MITGNRRLIAIMIVAALMLLTPLVAMQFTTEVNWTAFDFIVAGVLLFGTGLLLEFTLRRVQQKIYRVILCAAICIGLALIWLELAVGIFGTPLAGS